MLNILIVDDELPAIEAIRQRVHWTDQGIEKVFVADSAQAAREMFEREDIQLLLCDIEMPGESGLELLEWVNRWHEDVVSIFLTCHADFSYAKQAVHMGAFDYLLKPALIGDIEEVVGRAAAEYEKRQSRLRVARQWQQNKETLEQQFWIEYLRGNLSLPLNQLETELKRRGIDVDITIAYLPVICSVRRWVAASGKDFESLEYAWKNLLEELFTFDGHLPAVLTETVGKKVILIPCFDTDGFLWAMEKNSALSEPEHEPGRAGFETRCRKFIDVLQQFFIGREEFYRGSACFYVGQCALMEQLPDIYGRVLALEQKNVAYDGQIFYLDHERTPSIAGDVPWPEHWRELMEGQQLEKLSVQIQQYLDKAVFERRMSRDFLRQFYHNFSQMVYAVLATKDILAQQLLGNIVPSPEEAQQSVEQMAVYVRAVLSAAMDYMNTVGHGNQVVETVKAYINEHIYEDISRDDLAHLVYLNPNYLSRLFSNATGTSLIDYITSSKLARVRQLLKNPELSVTEAAGQVGYTNMPYFSRLYKKKFGIGPAEDRKRMLERV